MPAFRFYRRWAVESAALDLALRQAGRSLGEALDREHRPIASSRRCASANPPSFEPVGRRLEAYPWLRFKLDGTPDWPGELIDQLGDDRRDRLDRLQGRLQGDAVDVDTDPGFYRRSPRRARRVARGPRPDRPRGRRGARAPPHRITWDAPIHSVADIATSLSPRKTVNVKPSRFGSTEALFAAYDYCAERGIEITAAARWSSASAAARSRSSPRSSIPTASTTSRRRATTGPSSRRDCQPSPLDPDPSPPGCADGHRIE